MGEVKALKKEISLLEAKKRAFEILQRIERIVARPSKRPQHTPSKPETPTKRLKF